MSNPTSNFNWQMPTSTDLVTDLPADFEVFGQAVDSTLADLKGGTTGQVLAKASATDMDFTWTNVDPLTILDAKGDLITATAADTPARLAVGSSGQVLTVDTTTSTGLAWASPSSGGWTLRKSYYEITAGTGQVYGIAYLNNLWWAWGTQGKLAYSSDGTTWTTPTSGFGTTAIRSVTYGNGLYVAVGSSGVLSTSSDGTTWTTRTSGFSTSAIYDVTYGNGIYVAVGQAAKISYSTDGVTWTNSTNGSFDFTRVTYLSSGTVFSAIGYTTFYSSTNGSSWTSRSVVWGSGAYQAAVVGTSIYMAGEDQNWYVSTNGTSFNGSTVQGILANAGYTGQNLRGIAAYDADTVLSVNASNSSLPLGLVKWKKSTVSPIYGTAYDMTHPIAIGQNYNVAGDGTGKIMCMDPFWSVVTNF